MLLKLSNTYLDVTDDKILSKTANLTVLARETDKTRATIVFVPSSVEWKSAVKG